MPRGLARDHAEKRAALRKGAAKHFAEHGYDRASMASVASACGVSKALIYHYYDSKEALLFDILEGHLGALVNAVDTVPDTGAPEAQLRALIHAILTNYRDADAEHKLQIDALDTLPTDMKAPLIELQRRLVTRMSDVIAAIGVSGELRAVTMTVFGMLNWFYMWHRPGKGISREAYGDLVTDMVLGGVRNL
ncbi:TetR/AcrR family transcriptional regulator [Rhodophyticola porphyridii]|uniref:TetR/AcrR family transcriptional regulator n=1 Tax=Rhodophyticola porphyridii TaxID=1852017 RepID=A0A3L9Y3I9_9RHOB|nr:TetR/AcrR family transcriptional regulator [Rhodophyticola porphyridii]RMA43391.1 TetR/AcrR family transcriptional regulator [Rhodophyticola porphyridii]